MNLSTFRGFGHQTQVLVRCDEAMTEADVAPDRTALVPGVHRLIRALDTSEGPFPGLLVSNGDGVAVCIDAVEITDWGGWAYSDADHICGVIDLRRRADGQDALVPWCTQRVETFVGRRLIADAPLAAGELGTLVASLLRGLRELTADPAGAVGDWWLTSDGRPLFVHGDGGDARAGTASLVERIAGHTSDRATVRVLGEIAAALRERRHHADDDSRWEEQLFARAAPRALRLDVFAPEKAADLVRVGAVSESPVTGRRILRARSAPTGSSKTRAFLDAVRAELSERTARARSRLGDRLRRAPESGERASARGSRRRPLILAGALAAAVLMIGLMWPEGSESDPASAAQKLRPVPEPSAAASEEQPAPDASPAGTLPVDDPRSQSGNAEVALSAVPALLNTFAMCAAESAESCPEAAVDGVGMPTDGLAILGSDASTASLVDDYGDVAVVKLTPVEADDTTAEQQMIVLERREQKWLVRDIYDVAHQPDQG